MVFGVAAAEEFESDVAALGAVHPASDAAAVVEIGGDADVIDAEAADGVVDGIEVLLEGSLGSAGVDGGEAAVVGGEAFGVEFGDGIIGGVEAELFG